MKTIHIAVLLTCHNRKEKTLACLTSLYFAINQVNEEYNFTIYLVDDGSTDGTAEAVLNQYPTVKVIEGNGNLFWAGGMRLAWSTALAEQNYDAYLLLNDDVVLVQSFICEILKTHEHSLAQTGESGIYCGTTIDKATGLTSYGGLKIVKNDFVLRTTLINTVENPQVFHMANANVLWICNMVVDRIGLLDEKYTHSLADFDYTLTAFEHKIPLWVVPGVSGFCSRDHGNSWRPSTTSLKDRIAYLKSPKGLAYHEYLYYVRKHFPLFYPYSYIMLWVKTFFPFIW
ncbi:MAG TPA: glycosyltransferase family 2 protein, partial [Paludibacter sp.]|nr:glycosyltransferase family 2 protein [Paludibacter sp.]